MKTTQELLNELIENETSIAQPSDTWLINQYPAYPKDRLKKSNYLNYEHLETFDRDLTEKVKTMIFKEHNIPTVILATITKTKKLCKRPLLILIKAEAYYYKQYELFASAFRLSGFVELFHNIEASK